MDSLLTSTVAKKLREIATTSNVTSNEAQWLVKGASLIEVLEDREYELSQKLGLIHKIVNNAN